MTMTPFLQLFRLPPRTVNSILLIFHLCSSFVSLTSHMASFERTSAIIDTRFVSLWQANRCWCQCMNSMLFVKCSHTKPESGRDGKKEETKFFSRRLSITLWPKMPSRHRLSCHVKFTYFQFLIAACQRNWQRNIISVNKKSNKNSNSSVLCCRRKIIITSRISVAVEGLRSSSVC